MKSRIMTLFAFLIIGFATSGHAQNYDVGQAKNCDAGQAQNCDAGQAQNYDVATISLTEGCKFNPTEEESSALCMGQSIEPFYAFSIDSTVLDTEGSPHNIVPILFVNHDMYKKPKAYETRYSPVLKAKTVGMLTTWDDLEKYDLMSIKECGMDENIRVLSAEIVYDHLPYLLEQDHVNGVKLIPYRIQNMEFQCVKK